MKHKDNARGFIRLFSLECLAIALSIFPLLHTHAAPHQANEKGVVQEIVESRDSAVILFGRAQNMFALLFDDFDITLLNNDNRTIIASGRAKIGDYIRNNYDSNYRMVSFITYKIKIDCKDYKYRYSISDIKINTWREDKFERSVANGTETVFVTLRFCVVRKQLKATLKPNAAGVQLPPHYYRNG